jgi:hypothetical protein
LIIGDDLYAPVLVDAYTRIGGAEIDTNDWTFNFISLFSTVAEISNA